MQIRAFELDDYEQAATIWDDAEELSTPPREEVVEKLERDRDLFLVAEEDGTLLGVVMGTYDGRRGWIFRLAVRPEARRRGVGAGLVRQLERRCEARGITKLRLLVVADNERALRFWDSLGYERFDRVVMLSKDLDGPRGTAC
jgi:ribosomal protein S18 acetylase RimI-like enzyme